MQSLRGPVDVVADGAGRVVVYLDGACGQAQDGWLVDAGQVRSRPFVTSDTTNDWISVQV
jgi:hypothetical protein